MPVSQQARQMIDDGLFTINIALGRHAGLRPGKSVCMTMSQINIRRVDLSRHQAYRETTIVISI